MGAAPTKPIKRIPVNTLYGLSNSVFVSGVVNGKAYDLSAQRGRTYEIAISEMINMTVEFYATKKDAKKIGECARRLVFSLIYNVCGNRVNLDLAPCIVLACTILVIMKIRNVPAVRDNDILSQIGAKCDMEKTYDIMEDIKSRSFSQETCEIIA